MARYTKKIKVLPRVDKDGTEHWVEDIVVSDRGAADKKLYDIENIEDFFGIDLIKLINMKVFYLKEGDQILKIEMGYVRNEDNMASETLIDFTEKCIHIADYWGCDYMDETQVPFEDYGKTWALTKEELKDE